MNTIGTEAVSDTDYASRIWFLVVELRPLYNYFHSNRVSYLYTCGLKLLYIFNI